MDFMKAHSFASTLLALLTRFFPTNMVQGGIMNALASAEIIFYITLYFTVVLTVAYSKLRTANRFSGHAAFDIILINKYYIKIYVFCVNSNA
jgi:hypothetical protein